MNHLAIIGAGSVGTAIAFAALNRGVAGRVSLYDVNGAKALAEVLDLRHGLQFLRPAIIEGGDDLALCRDASVVVVTAGAKQRPGENRLDLTARNADLLRQLLPQVIRVAPKALLLIVTNPVDVLTQLAIQVTGRAEGTVLGSGTVLDSSRLRHLLALRYQIAERHVHAYVVGEHGDSETVLWSSATIGGASISEVPCSDGQVLSEADRKDILHQVRHAAYQIIAGKGATSWAIGLATVHILEALDHADYSSVLPVTAPIPPDIGLGEVCISLPRRVDAAGAGRVLPLTATPQEHAALRASAQAVKSAFDSLG
ncbi:MAG TPA: L-lactate dehydrogenase [Acidimicrobiia bacterium]|nr:L-lactate dehydrogenase [Acidimicrobiia bacterium]